MFVVPINEMLIEHTTHFSSWTGVQQILEILGKK